MRRIVFMIAVLLALISAVAYAEAPKSAASQESLITSSKTLLEEAKKKAHERKRVQKEADKYSIICDVNDIDECEKFLQRIKKSKALIKAFVAARSAGINVFLDEEFEANAGYIRIDLSATDEEIVGRLLGTKQK